MHLRSCKLWVDSEIYRSGALGLVFAVSQIGCF